MKTSAKYVSLIYIIFILLLSIAGSFSGALGEALYYGAFILTGLMAFIVIKKCQLKSLTMSRPLSLSGLGLTALAVFPTVSLLLLLSFITSFLLSLGGFVSPTPDVSGNLAYVILTSALLPAILEEIIFRYVPVSLIAPYSRRGAVLFSALSFALVHCSLFQIPYAFFAGIVFASITIASRSIIPSVIIHFCNNVISIIMMRYGGVENFIPISIAVLVALSILSLAIAIIFRVRIFEQFKSVFEGKCKELFTAEYVIFILFTLAIATFNLV